MSLETLAITVVVAVVCGLVVNLWTPGVQRLFLVGRQASLRAEIKAWEQAQAQPNILLMAGIAQLGWIVVLGVGSLGLVLLSSEVSIADTHGDVLRGVLATLGGQFKAPPEKHLIPGVSDDDLAHSVAAVGLSFMGLGALQLATLANRARDIDAVVATLRKRLSRLEGS